jgi:flagellar FliJ protein
MKPFALGAVLKYRKQLEDMARQQLHQAVEAEMRLIEALNAVQENLAELYAGLAADQERGTTVDRLILYDHRIALVKEQMHLRKKELQKQQVQVEKKRQALVKASKNRKVMEKLREQQTAAYKKYLEKKESNMLDEIAVLSHERKQG